MGDDNTTPFRLFSLLSAIFTVDAMARRPAAARGAQRFDPIGLPTPGYKSCMDVYRSDLLLLGDRQMKRKSARAKRVLAAAILFGVMATPAQAVVVNYFDDTGLLQLDTEGLDFVGLLVSGPNFTPGCILCDGDSLPLPTAPPPSLAFYAVGFVSGTTQWIRTFPLTGDGPIGVFDLSIGATGLTDADFPPLFGDPSNPTWSFQFLTDSQGPFFGNVNVVSNGNDVPEPGSIVLFLLGGLMLLRRRC